MVMVMVMVMPKTPLVSMRKFGLELQEYVFTNGILAVAAGWVIGNATKELIDELLSAFRGSSLSDWAMKSGSALAVWFVTIVMTFVVLEYILGRRVFRIKTAVKSDEKAEFDKAKILAQNDKLLVSEEDLGYLP